MHVHVYMSVLARTHAHHICLCITCMCIWVCDHVPGYIYIHVCGAACADPSYSVCVLQCIVYMYITIIFTIIFTILKYIGLEFGLSVIYLDYTYMESVIIHNCNSLLGNRRGYT